MATKLKKEEKYILLGIIFIFAMGFVMHQIYDWSGGLFVVGLFAPVNESIFEHMKLVPIPMLLWWGIYFVKNRGLNDDLWFTCALISLVVSMLCIPLLYYFYTGAFGVHIMIVDILILLVALLFGQVLALHFYRHGKALPIAVSLSFIALIIAFCAFLSVYPPKIPLFLSSDSGIYGM